MRKTDAYERLGMLPPGESARIALAMGSASVNERKMYARVLGELDLLQAGSIKPADYFIRVQKHAAALSGGNGNEFMSLVGMAFSAPGGDPKSDLERIAMGAGPHLAGSALERIYTQVANRQGGSTAANGFNRDIVDTDQDSTVTHHFGEMLQVGANRGQLLASMAQDHLDGPENPGDVRNGNFAAMLGDALRSGRISPNQAVALTEWAYANPKAHPSFPPVSRGPWNPGTSKFEDAINTPAEAGHAQGTIQGYQVGSWLAAMKADR